MLKAYNLELEGMIKILKDENEQLKGQEVTIMSKHHLLLSMLLLASRGIVFGLFCTRHFLLENYHVVF